MYKSPTPSTSQQRQYSSWSTSADDDMTGEVQERRHRPASKDVAFDGRGRRVLDVTANRNDDSVISLPEDDLESSQVYDDDGSSDESETTALASRPSLSSGNERESEGDLNWNQHHLADSDITPGVHTDSLPGMRLPTVPYSGTGTSAIIGAAHDDQHIILQPAHHHHDTLASYLASTLSSPKTRSHSSSSLASFPTDLLSEIGDVDSDPDCGSGPSALLRRRNPMADSIQSLATAYSEKEGEGSAFVIPNVRTVGESGSEEGTSRSESSEEERAARNSTAKRRPRPGLAKSANVAGEEGILRILMFGGTDRSRSRLSQLITQPQHADFSAVRGQASSSTSPNSPSRSLSSPDQDSFRGRSLFPGSATAGRGGSSTDGSSVKDDDPLQPPAQRVALSHVLPAVSLTFGSRLGSSHPRVVLEEVSGAAVAYDRVKAPFEALRGILLPSNQANNPALLEGLLPTLLERVDAIDVCLWLVPTTSDDFSVDIPFLRDLPSMTTLVPIIEADASCQAIRQSLLHTGIEFSGYSRNGKFSSLAGGAKLYRFPGESTISGLDGCRTPAANIVNALLTSSRELRSFVLKGYRKSSAAQAKNSGMKASASATIPSVTSSIAESLDISNDSLSRSPSPYSTHASAGYGIAELSGLTSSPSNPASSTGWHALIPFTRAGCTDPLHLPTLLRLVGLNLAASFRSWKSWCFRSSTLSAPNINISAPIKEEKAPASEIRQNPRSRSPSPSASTLAPSSESLPGCCSYRFSRAPRPEEPCKLYRCSGLIMTAIVFGAFIIFC